MLYFEDIPLNDVLQSQSYRVSKESIIAFGKEYDPQPFHIDEEEAKQWPTGLMASSIQTYALSMKLMHQLKMEPLAAIAGLGVDEMRMSHPVKPDDSIYVKVWIEHARLSKSNPERGIATTRVEVYNQEDILVLSYKNSSLVMCRPK